ncbi:MAG: hypothetical protein ACLGHM_11355 [Actinomycetes bacterium]|jgi:hypothetical protein
MRKTDLPRLAATAGGFACILAILVGFDALPWWALSLLSLSTGVLLSAAAPVSMWARWRRQRHPGPSRVLLLEVGARDAAVLAVLREWDSPVRTGAALKRGVEHGDPIVVAAGLSHSDARRCVDALRGAGAQADVIDPT